MQKQQLSKVAPGVIALVGLPGSGKSTIGQHLAKRLDVPLIDSDARIEGHLRCSIRDFFEYKGEDRFREIEHAVISKALSEGPCVLSTGGGVILRSENRHLLHTRSTVVYLRANVVDIFKRIGRDKRRPLLQGSNPLGKLRELLQARDGLYREVAHITLDTGCPAVHMLVEEIATQIELKTCRATASLSV